MPYLHCAHCRRSAWLDSESEPSVRCHYCDAALEPMRARHARLLVAAVRERFLRDEAQEPARRRFVRD